MAQAQEEFSTERQVLPCCERALVLVDFINPLNFEGSQALAPGALAAAQATHALRERLWGEGVPVIFANDNYGLWRSNFQAMVRHCLSLPAEPGEIARLLAPGPRDIAILKPRHSAFYGTPLALLLEQMRVRQLILTGLATDICVLMTAMDAYLRSYTAWVPADCTAAESEDSKAWALDHMQRVLKCDVRPSTAGTPAHGAASGAGTGGAQDASSSKTAGASVRKDSP